MSVPVDALLRTDGPEPTSDPVTRSDLWSGLLVWTAQHYRGYTIHRTPDCHQLRRVDSIGADRLGDLPNHYSVCRSQDCWPETRDRSPDRTCPYCGSPAEKLRYHLPCEEAGGQ